MEQLDLWFWISYWFLFKQLEFDRFFCPSKHKPTSDGGASFIQQQLALPTGQAEQIPWAGKFKNYQTV